MKIEKMVGCMIGLAVGDALGVPVEFKDREDIYEKYGVLDKMVEGGTWGQPAGTVSDDTKMALCVAEGIVENHVNPIPAIGRKFVEWYESKPFDIGICCASVISDAIRNQSKTANDWFRVANEYRYRSGGRSEGNGGLMRTAFVGCYYKTLKDVEKYAFDICGMTHVGMTQNDCSLVSLIIHELIEGGSKETIERFVKDYSETKGRYNLGEIEGYPFRVKPSGYGMNSLKCALKCVLKTRTFKEAVVEAVNMGGDTDTIGAITGAIAGALYGIDEIPKEWVNSLDKEIVDKLADVVAEASIYRFGGEYE